MMLHYLTLRSFDIKLFDVALFNVTLLMLHYIKSIHFRKQDDSTSELA